MEAIGGLLGIFAIIWVIGFVICLVLSLILTLFGLFKQTISGVSVLFLWASKDLGFIGIAILFICWGTVPIVMLIACTLIGIFSQTGRISEDTLKKSEEDLYEDEPLSDYEKKRGF